MTEVTTEKPADKVAKYVQLRDAKKSAEEKFKAFCDEHFNTKMDALEGELLALLDSLGLDSIASPFGTAYKNMSTSVTLADAREFTRHVIGTQDFGLVDMRPSKTAVQELVAQGEQLPPGVNYTTFMKVGIRRK